MGRGEDSLYCFILQVFSSEKLIFKLFQVICWLVEESVFLIVFFWQSFEFLEIVDLYVITFFYGVLRFCYLFVMVGYIFGNKQKSECRRFLVILGLDFTGVYLLFVFNNFISLDFVYYFVLSGFFWSQILLFSVCVFVCFG